MSGRPTEDTVTPLVDSTARRAWGRLDRQTLAERQLARLNELLREILPHNPFYREKLGSHARLRVWEDLQRLPLTTKDDLVAGQTPGPWPTNLTYPLDRYVRYHQTSGTSGFPLKVLDTAEDWRWWIETWQYVFDSADVTAADRGVLAFSFGPFVGFWSAFDALVERGAMAIPTGGLSSLARLELIESTRATLLLCTPSYALHLADLAERHRKRLPEMGLRALIVAGEPGGSIPAVRARIEQAWGATLLDHAGASEVGPWGFADSRRTGLHVTESEFIAEFLSADGDRPAAEGELSELVLTNLGRRGSPIIRYRTGDMVRPIWGHDRDCRFVLLEGGVLGRRDDMLIIRGVNIFPSSLEQILRGIDGVAEFRVTAFREGAMDQLRIEVESERASAAAIGDVLSARLGLRVAVAVVPAASLPRSEFKSRRLVDLRRSGTETPGA